MRKKTIFTTLSKKAAYYTGHPGAFFVALSIIVLWGLSGPLFGFNDTWQLVINTGTTIITFLMVFLIQSTQNRDTVAMQLKLDELIRATSGAHTLLLDLEELSEEELEYIRGEYEKIAERARKNLKSGRDDTNNPPINISNISAHGDDNT